METVWLRLGPFAIELSGDSPIAALAAEELAPLAGPESAPGVRLVVTERPADPPPDDATLIGDVAAIEGRAWLQCTPMPWTLVLDHAGPVPLATLHVEPAPTGGLAAARHRARNRSFLSPAEQQAYLVVHFIVELLVLLFSEDVALIHSSAVSIDDRALMLISTGGTGKTSGAAELINRHGFAFLSDDITPVTVDGEALFWPRRIMIYPYNLAESAPFRDRVLGGRTVADRLHWTAGRALKGAKGPRRRVTAAELFGDGSVGRGAQIEWAVFLARWSGEDFRVDPTDHEVLADRSRHILAIEFGQPLKWLHEWAATGHCPLPPDAMLDRQRDLMARALSAAPSRHDLRVPRRVHPVGLAQYLRTLCLG